MRLTPGHVIAPFGGGHGGLPADFLLDARGVVRDLHFRRAAIHPQRAPDRRRDEQVAGEPLRGRPRRAHHHVRARQERPDHPPHHVVRMVPAKRRPYSRSGPFLLAP